MIGRVTKGDRWATLRNDLRWVVSHDDLVEFTKRVDVDYADEGGGIPPGHARLVALAELIGGEVEFEQDEWPTQDEGGNPIVY